LSLLSAFFTIEWWSFPETKEKQALPSSCIRACLWCACVRVLAGRAFVR
jgi:hypothetical protein